MNESGKNFAKVGWRTSLLVACIVLMIIGLLCSRALLSCALIIFVALSVINGQLVPRLGSFVSSPLLWSISLLFFVPLISGMWSADVDKWASILRIKLPLLLLPLCFAGNENLKARHWETIAVAFIVLMLGAVGWSVAQYFQDASSMQQAYLKAQTLPTPLENDHVRFSLLIDIAILTTAFLLITRGRIYKKGYVVSLRIVILIFILYLHLLAVRTGLLCLYAGLLISACWLAAQQMKMKYALLLIVIPALPLMAYFSFPTFKNRVLYLEYDLSLLRSHILVSGSNDGNRLLSINAGWEILNDHPLEGVGFGDIKSEVDSLYLRNYPQMAAADKILPSSEWMIYGDGAGWPGLVIFSVVMLVPFFNRPLRSSVVWWLVNLFLLLSYLFDIGLEVQFGVFIHGFVLLWYASWLPLEKQVRPSYAGVNT